MTTRITVNVNGSRLLKQARENQLANRQTLTQKESDDKFLADVRQIEASAAAQAAARQREGAVPEYGIKEQTSAQRKSGSTLARLVFNFSPRRYPFFGSPHRLEFYKINIRSFYPYNQYVALPNETIYPDVPAVPDNTSIVGFENSLTFNGPTGTYISTNGNDWSAWWAMPLPAGGKYVVLVFVLRKVSYAFKEIHVITSTPPGATLNSHQSIPLGTYEGASYHCRLIDTGTMQFKIIQNVPQQLRDHIDAFLSPLNSVIGTESFTYNNGSSDFSAIRLQQPNEFITTYPAPTPTSYRTYNQRRYYGVPDAAQQIAQSFGLGKLTTASHLDFNNTIPGLAYGTSYYSTVGLPSLSDFITPAVFKYLKGEATLTPNMQTNYASVRTALNNIPFKNTFISFDTNNYATGPGPTKQQLLQVGSIQTNVLSPSSPLVNLTVPVAQNLIKTRKITQSVFGYDCKVWDWDNPQYCRTQLLSLGFTESDLTMPT